MAAPVNKILLEYLAHVQRSDGSTVELSGTRSEATINDCYKWLVKRAGQLSGHLVSQRINVYDVARSIPDVVPEVKVQVPSVFKDSKVFGVYTTPYVAAQSITYKVTKE